MRIIQPSADTTTYRIASVHTMNQKLFLIIFFVHGVSVSGQYLRSRSKDSSNVSCMCIHLPIDIMFLYPLLPHRNRSTNTFIPNPQHLKTIELSDDTLDRIAEKIKAQKAELEYSEAELNKSIENASQQHEPTRERNLKRCRGRRCNDNAFAMDFIDSNNVHLVDSDNNDIEYHIYNYCGPIKAGTGKGKGKGGDNGQNPGGKSKRWSDRGRGRGGYDDYDYYYR